MSLSTATLVLIDFQVGFDDPFWGTRNNLDAERNAIALLEAVRDAGGLVAHVRHFSLEPGSPLSNKGTDFKPGLSPKPGELVYQKSVNSAFIGTTLEADLCARNVEDLIICGLTTPHCVSTSTRMAANLGFSVTLAMDACAAYTGNADVSFDGGPMPSAQEIHRAAIYQLHGEFAQAVSVSTLLPNA